jgi:hypothetical protein
MVSPTSLELISSRDESSFDELEEGSQSAGLRGAASSQKGTLGVGTRFTRLERLAFGEHDGRREVHLLSFLYQCLYQELFVAGRHDQMPF